MQLKHSKMTPTRHCLTIPIQSMSYIPQRDWVPLVQMHQRSSLPRRIFWDTTLLRRDGSYLLYKAAVSLFCACACVCTPPHHFFSTRPADRNQLWHIYSNRYGTGSNLKKWAPRMATEGLAHWHQSPKWDLAGVSKAFDL